MAETEDECGSTSRSSNCGKSAAEMRKINKPLMEKKRRERINNCLNQLKMFLMEATKKDSSYYSKLEKADILEMSVKYLKNLQRQHIAVAMANDPKVISKYATGYSQCANEVTRYLAKLDGLDPEVKGRLASHLNNCVQKLSSQATTANMVPGMTSFPVGSNSQLPVSLAPPTGITQQHNVDLTQFGIGNANNLNDIKQEQTMIPQQSPNTVAGVPVLPVQLIPAKLPSGDVVFFLTNNQSSVSNLNAPVQGVSNLLTTIQGVQTSVTPATATSNVTDTKVTPPKMTSQSVLSTPVTPKVVTPDSSTSPKDKIVPTTSILTLNVTSAPVSDLIRPYPMTSFPSSFNFGKPPSKCTPLKLDTDSFYLNSYPKAGTSASYPSPPSPSEALDLSAPHKDLNNNYNDVMNRNRMPVPPAGHENDPMWRPW